jgi:uncharacterized DUF497 family protein
VRFSRIYPASPEIESKLGEKHGLTLVEVREAFANRHVVRKAYVDQYGQRRYYLLGESNAGRLLTVFFVREGRAIKIITARDADARERRYFMREVRNRR